jgi:predicted enzyme related to lactoylglutathione lyase
VIRKLDVVVFRVRDWGAAVRFYTEKLGLTLLHSAEEDQWAMLGLPEGDTRIGLLGGQGAPQPSVQCADLAGTLEDLRRRGVPVTSDLRASAKGYRVATIADPEGNEIQLYDWT